LKKPFHCFKCGLCRVGPKEQLFHCDTCDCCLSIYEKNHKCISKRTAHNCPVCLEDLHTSTKGFHFLKCGHSVHPNCFNDMIENKIYKCPLCSKLIVKIDNEQMDFEIENTQMPDEYKDILVKILCNECQNKNEVKFHIVGLKCPDCKSYNTSRI